MGPRLFRAFLRAPRPHRLAPRAAYLSASSLSSLSSLSSSCSSISGSLSTHTLHPHSRRKPVSLLRACTLALAFAAFVTTTLSSLVYTAHRPNLAPAPAPAGVTVTGQSLRPPAVPPTAPPAPLHHPVTLLTARLLALRNFTSMLDYPCRAHRAIAAPLLRLHQSHHPPPHPPLQYICADHDSAQLSISHVLVRRALPDYPTARYRRLNALRAMPAADLLLHWHPQPAGRGGEGLRDVLLTARAVGVRVAIVGTSPFVGTEFSPEEALVSEKRLKTMRPGVYGLAPFPFAHAIAVVSGAYDEQRMLVVYDLDVLPELGGSRVEGKAGRDPADDAKDGA